MSKEPQNMNSTKPVSKLPLEALKVAWGEGFTHINGQAIADELLRRAENITDQDLARKLIPVLGEDDELDGRPVSMQLREKLRLDGDA
jgi:hypothetical protein